MTMNSDVSLKIGWNLVQDILRLSESLLVGSGGRHLLQAMHFGGVARLSRRIAQCLNYASLHRDQFKQESCIPFLESRYNPHVKHLLRPSYSDPSEVVELITERIVESNLSAAMKAILSRNTEDLHNYYESHACVRQNNCVKILLEGTRLLDEQDLAGLAELQLFKTTSAECERVEVPLSKPCPIKSSTKLSDDPSNSCPDLTHTGINRYLKARNWTEDESVSSEASSFGSKSVAMPLNSFESRRAETCPSSVVKMGQKSHRKRHKRSVSDTAAVIKSPVVNDPQPKDGVFPRRLSHLVEEDGPSSHEEVPDSNEWASIRPPCGGWQLPRPDFGDQSLFDYIISGNFSRHQAPLDQDNAHIFLSEVLIYSGYKFRKKSADDRASTGLADAIQQLRENTERFNDTGEENEVMAGSAEATLLKFLVNLDDPREPKAKDLVEILKERGEFADDTDDEVDDIGGVIGENNDVESTELRGTHYWAPPRPQLILKIHEKPSLKIGVRMQKYFCNDCGMRVAAAFAHTFRFCHYYGKFSCTTCHTNALHVLPAHILYRWDFKEYKVSNFALRVLKRLSSDSLFPMNDVELARKVSKLQKAIALREQAYSVAKYLRTCRFAEEVRESTIDCLNIKQPSVLSLNELCSVKLGVYPKVIKKQIDRAMAHVLHCDLCMARGFMCENCRCEEPIFPFHSGVKQCTACHACYHTSCYRTSCPKCMRIQQRKLSIENSDNAV